MCAFFKRILSLSSRYAADRSGNVIITFAIALIPIFGVIGVVVDYGRAASARSAMQAAADATALMVSKEAMSASPAVLNTKADAYFKALLNKPEITGLTVSAAYSTTSSGQTLQVDATGNIPNQFMSAALLGDLKTTKIGTSSTVRWGARYRVALALDNTGSMASASKMTELKIAAKKMIEDFAVMAKTTEDIYISIVPFSKDVNVGQANKSASWVSWDYIGTCSQGSIKTGPACRAAGKTWTTTGGQKNAWTGCVTDRDFAHVADHDLKNTLPSASNRATLFDAENYIVDGDDLCPVSMIGMTSVYSKKQDLLNKINAMTPVGNTNQTIGLQWAWMTHQIGQGPFPSPAKDATMDYVDVIILLTDGDNTENRWDNCSSLWWVYNCKATRLDSRQETLCSNIKTEPGRKKPIEIFTVQVATSGDAVQPVTKGCATKPDDPTYYSFITNATQLSTKFKNIFESIARLRVSG